MSRYVTLSLTSIESTIYSNLKHVYVHVCLCIFMQLSYNSIDCTTDPNLKHFCVSRYAMLSYNFGSNRRYSPSYSQSRRNAYVPKRYRLVLSEIILNISNFKPLDVFLLMDRNIANCLRDTKFRNSLL